MYSYGFFQTDVLINLFIPLRRDEAITWENFVPAKRYSGSKKEDGTFYMQLQDTIYEEFITLPGSRQNGTKFNLGKPESCNHHLTLSI